MSAKGNVKAPSERDARIWAEIQSGTSKSDLAKRLDVTVATITGICKKVESFFLSRVTVDVAALKASQHIQQDRVKREAWKAWKKSGGVVTRKKMKFNDEGKMIECEETSEQKAGDPRFLGVVLTALKEQREMWPGANAPRTNALTNADGTGDARLEIDVQQKMAEMPPEVQAALAKYAESVIDVTPES